MSLQLLDAHLGNGSGHRTVTMMAPLLLTSDMMRYEAVLHNCETSAVGGGVPTCDSAHSWQLYGTASPEHQAVATMTCYPTLLTHYPDTEPTSQCPILIMSSTRLGSNEYQF